MNLNAYAELDRVALPRPRVSDLEEVVDENSESVFYHVRYGTTRKGPTVITSAWAHRNRGLLHSLRASGDLLQLERAVLSSFGGCLLTAPRESYVELVIGHLSGLLLRGWCAARSLHGQTDRMIRSCQQPTMMEQQLPTIVEAAADEADRSVIDAILGRAHGYATAAPEGSLLEFIVDRDGAVLFVDIKEYPWALDLRCLVEDSLGDDRVVYRQPGWQQRGRAAYVGPYDLAAWEHARMYPHLVLGDHAMLCHFVTYSLRAGHVGTVTA